MLKAAQSYSDGLFRAGAYQRSASTSYVLPIFPVRTPRLCSGSQPFHGFFLGFGYDGKLPQRFFPAHLWGLVFIGFRRSLAGALLIVGVLAVLGVNLVVLGMALVVAIVKQCTLRTVV